MLRFSSPDQYLDKISLILRSTWIHGQLILLSFVLVFCGAILGIPSVEARQLGRTLSLNPLIMDYQLQIGKGYERNIRITNMNSEIYRISYKPFDVMISPKHNVTFLPEESLHNTKRSLASWIHPMSEEQFMLQPGEFHDFPFRIDIPDFIDPGDYYASVNFYFTPVREQSELTISTRSVVVRQSLGTLLLVSVDGEGGELHRSAELKDQDVTGLQIGRMGEWETEVSVGFVNNGLRFIHLIPVIRIKDEEGEIYYQSGGKSKRVFPGENVRLTHQFPSKYLNALNPLIMSFELWDNQMKTKYYESQMKIGGYMPGSDNLPDWLVDYARVFFFTGIALVLIVFYFYWDSLRKLKRNVHTTSMSHKVKMPRRRGKK